MTDLSSTPPPQRPDEGSPGGPPGPGVAAAGSPWGTAPQITEPQVAGPAPVDAQGQPFPGTGGPGFAAPQEPDGPTSQKRYNRGLVFSALGAAYAALAVGTAAAVVAVASPAPINFAALAAQNTVKAASGAASASASAGPSASPSPTPSPQSTVVGSVHDGVHSGDLRFFLLPPPDGPSSVQGDPAGTKEDLTDVLNEYGGDSTTKSILEQLGFKAGATITFQDSAIGANVTIELLQFGSSGDAAQWRSGFELDGDGWTRFTVSGESGASAWSQVKNGVYNYTGVYDEGDTFYQISIFGDQSVSHTAMATLIKQQHARLADG